MKALYIHIGCHKTGTSSLQFFLWNNRKILKNYGYLYPKSGLNGYSHGELANIIKPNNRDERLSEYKKQFHKEAQASDAEKIVVSSEVFMEGQNIAKAVRNFLDHNMFQVKIVIYLRNQPDWLESVYNEVVRDPCRRFTGTIFQLREFEQQLHNYRNVLISWENYFGKDNIIVRPYVREFWPDDSLFYDFLQTIHITDLQHFDCRIKKEKSNMRLHHFATEFLRRANRHLMMQDEHMQLVEELNRVSGFLNVDYPQPATVFTQSENKTLFESYSKQNRWLLNFYNCKDDADLFEQRKNINASVIDGFDAMCQYAIFEHLSPASQSRLEKTIPSVKNRIRGQPFIHAAPSNEIKRLNEIIMRQRFELRQLYNCKLF